MRMYDIIKTKRDGGVLSKEQIDYFVKEYTNGMIPDYQVAALLMAVYFQGMNEAETLAADTGNGRKRRLSFAVCHSRCNGG